MTFADIVKSGKDHQDVHARRTQGDYAQDAGSVHHDRRVGAAARYSLQDQRHGEIRHRHYAAGMVYGKVVTPPVRYGATVKCGRRQRQQSVDAVISAVPLVLEGISSCGTDTPIMVY